MDVTLCPDCGVEPGEHHHIYCDVARCIGCGGQSLQCGLDEDDETVYHVWSNDSTLPLTPTTKWTGEWPGVVECRELDLWSYFGPPWIKCDKDHPEATEDLNTYVRMCCNGELVWSQELERWIKP